MQLESVRSQLALTAVVSALLIGCASRTAEVPPSNPQITAAPKAPSPSQPLKEARRIAQEAETHGAAARSEIESAKSGLTNYRDEDYRGLQELVVRLQEKAAVTKEDLADLYDKVFAAEGKIQQLLTRLQRAADELEQESTLRRSADDQLVDAQVKLAAKEAEADQLRLQFADQKANSDSLEQSAKANHKAALEAAADKDQAIGQRNLVVKILIAVTIALALSLIVNYVQFRGSSVLPF